MADKYCSVRFKTGEELDEALNAAMCACDDAARAEAAAERAEAALQDCVRVSELSLTINPADGKVYIAVNGVAVGEGVEISTAAPVVVGDVQVENMVLTLANDQSVEFKVRLSEAPTTPQTVSILTNSDSITFDKERLTFTADNYSEYQTVVASAANVTEDETANIIVRNSDELMTDTSITVYLVSEVYSVDTTIPDGAHTLTEADIAGATAVAGYGILLKAYTGEYTNVKIPATFTYNGAEYSPVYFTPVTFAGNTTVQYVEFEDGVKISGSATTFTSADSSSNSGAYFKNCTSLVGVKNHPVPTANPIILLDNFSGCSALKFVTGIEEAVGFDNCQQAFYGCTSLEYVQDISAVPTNRETGYTDAVKMFYGCTSLKKVYGLPDFTNMTDCFNGCTNLEEATVPATVGTYGTTTNGTYGRRCFAGCVNLQKITVLTEVAAPDMPSTLNNACTIYAVPGTTVYTTLQSSIASLPTATLLPVGAGGGATVAVWGDSTSSLNNTWIDWPTRLGEDISGFTIKNQAVSGEYTTSTSARQGGNTLKVGAFTIPAETTGVSVVLTTEDGHTFGTNPVFSAGGSFNPCTIAGVKGTISASNGVYTFTRLTAGTEVEVPDSTEVLSVADEALNTAEVMLINLGNNSGWDEDADVLLNQLQLMVDHFIEMGGTKYIVCGPSAGKHLRTEELRSVVFDFESKAAVAFENNWLNLRQYCIENGLSDNGLEASVLDTERMAIGQIPASLLGGGTTTSIKIYDGSTVTDDVHPNVYGAVAIKNAFYKKGQALGYW